MNFVTLSELLNKFISIYFKIVKKIFENVFKGDNIEAWCF